METPTPPLTPAELELAETTGGIHINGLLLSRIKQWVNQPSNKTTIKKEVETRLWAWFGGKPSELVEKEAKRS